MIRNEGSNAVCTWEYFDALYLAEMGRKLKNITPKVLQEVVISSSGSYDVLKANSEILYYFIFLNIARTSAPTGSPIFKMYLRDRLVANATALVNVTNNVAGAPVNQFYDMMLYGLYYDENGATVSSWRLNGTYLMLEG
jgi:hypothetical protein